MRYPLGQTTTIQLFNHYIPYSRLELKHQVSDWYIALFVIGRNMIIMPQELASLIASRQNYTLHLQQNWQHAICTDILHSNRNALKMETEHIMINFPKIIQKTRSITQFVVIQKVCRRLVFLHIFTISEGEIKLVVISYRIKLFEEREFKIRRPVT